MVFFLTSVRHVVHHNTFRITAEKATTHKGNKGTAVARPSLATFIVTSMKSEVY